ncbi:GyrI-like domain-containing protein [Corynebacterium kalidii]|uniref:GyrI-like domain-containing protein n=1 Tax=Corynebacterium kalidii TaxID=2931982 RepID=A0A9X2AXM6_9CORY|nr:GyrI-like domain-containing protein [Corynebacterium kalidii]MCJ7857231.1 GyrI-like domain-containing protein [Corynebacterium kalidii]
MTTGKIDLKKTLDAYRDTRGTFRVVDVPTFRYIMVDGHGDPNTSPLYPRSLEALYPVAYAMKFASKRDLGRDYVVPPLEGLWWAEDMAAFTTARDKSRWYWTMMLMVPPWVGRDIFDAAVQQVAAKTAKTAKTKATPERLGDIRLEELSEGRCVQTLHIGSFDDEAAVLERMHGEFLPANGLRLDGTHHEIYFSDPRRTAPEKLRTLLRQPVAPASAPAQDSPGPSPV